MTIPQTAWEALHGPLVPMTDQERADFEAELRAIRAAEAGEDAGDLFRRVQAARETGC